MGNIDKIKSTIKGWRLGDYFRQFSIVAAGIIVQRQRFPGGRRDGYPDGGTRAGRHHDDGADDPGQDGRCAVCPRGPAKAAGAGHGHQPQNEADRRYAESEGLYAPVHP